MCGTKAVDPLCVRDWKGEAVTRGHLVKVIMFADEQVFSSSLSFQRTGLRQQPPNSGASWLHLPDDVDRNITCTHSAVCLLGVTC